jgi:DNA modification methylase
MGSGTTALACIEFDRDFIGIEMDDKYFGIANKRINELTL